MFRRKSAHHWQVIFHERRRRVFPAIALLERMQARHDHDLVARIAERIDALEEEREPGDERIKGIAAGVDLRKVDVFVGSGETPAYTVFFTVEAAQRRLRILGIGAAGHAGQRLRGRRLSLRCALALYSAGKG